MNTTIQTTVLKGDWFSYYFMFICVDITALRCCFYALYDNKETLAGLDCTINSNFNKKHTATWVKECFGMNQVFVSSQVTSAGWNSETYHRSHTLSMPQRPGEALFSFCWVVVFFSKGWAGRWAVRSPRKPASGHIYHLTACQDDYWIKITIWHFSYSVLPQWTEAELLQPRVPPSRLLITDHTLRQPAGETSFCQDNTHPFSFLQMLICFLIILVSLASLPGCSIVMMQQLQMQLKRY